MKYKDILKKNINDEDNILFKYIINEEKKILEFLSGFDIVGLTIATILGLNITSFAKIISKKLIIPLLSYLIEGTNLNNASFILINDIKIEYGIILTEIFHILFIILLLYYCYSFLNKYVNELLVDKKSISYNNFIVQKKILKELKKLNNKKE